MDDAINLTIALAGWLYIGSFAQWKAYATVLTRGKLSKYKQSAAFHNQSLTAFFGLFRSLWDTGKSPQPNPETFGLIPLRPANLTQDEIIDELIAHSDDDAKQAEITAKRKSKVITMPQKAVAAS